MPNLQLKDMTDLVSKHLHMKQVQMHQQVQHQMVHIGMTQLTIMTFTKKVIMHGKVLQVLVMLS